ncbi:tRNA (adenine(22)-N(1))-methyltransferase TrmK [Colwellia sp. E2M01]|uniref:tRNA (adenine(22)-N(1))-methyltransferase n=1 Tax=Colwellia sp. E2M01 TaxID=2841561 RepID=UPI0020915FA1|nr:tRNA (adenine(22)-N(1))-methyltransferase TrmK [Colwellia sp. E2M01]
MKLSKRLQQIEQLVHASFRAEINSYQHIWDCCCDHGLLGFSLLSHQVKLNASSSSKSDFISHSKVHFVDIVPALMDNINDKLHRFYDTLKSDNFDHTQNINPYWQTHCIDVAQLPLHDYEGKHLVIIAGVGGDLMIKFIEQLNRKYSNKYNQLNLDYLLCPVHHQYPLREKLIELNFSLNDEVLIEDNQRFYEILYVSSASQLIKNPTRINPVGDKLWLSTSTQQTEIAQKYRQKTLNHYSRIQQGLQHGKQENNDHDINRIQNIIDAYSGITL